MIDLINRQAAIDKFEPWLNAKGYSEGELNMLKAVLYEIRLLPTEDVAPVVRCRDCVWRYHDAIDGDETDWCGVWANETQENAFCSYGRGRNNG